MVLQGALAKSLKPLGCLLGLATIALLTCGGSALAAQDLPAVQGLLDAKVDSKIVSSEVSQAVRSVVLLTAVSLLPAIIVSMTAFIRIVLVLSMVRHAFGMPETPPNMVLVSLALFLTAFTMMPTLDSLQREAVGPFLENKLTVSQALERAAVPMRTFMLKQTREQDLQLMYDLAKKPLPESPEQVSLMQLTPAFILNELRVAFQIGFVIMLPFLLLDLVVSSVMLALGMLMVPPATIALPLKILMFVLIDGWGLVVKGLLTSFRT